MTHKGQWRWALGVFLDRRLNKRLSKQWWCWWFETSSCPLWRHSNGVWYVASNWLVCDVAWLDGSNIEWRTPKATCIEYMGNLQDIWALVTGGKFHRFKKAADCLLHIFRVTGPLCGEFTVTGEFPSQRPVMRSFDVFFDLCLNKQSWGWWFETPSRQLWRHCNGIPKSYLTLTDNHPTPPIASYVTSKSIGIYNT